MKTPALLSWTAVVVTSVGVHAGVFAALGRPQPPAPPRPQPPSFMELAALPSPSAAPAATLDEPRAAKPSARRAVAKRTSAPVAAPPDAPQATETEALADFTGTTLTNDGTGAAWNSATGNGERMAGPVGQPAAKVTGQNVHGAPDVGTGEPVVGAGDLSRLPQAPALDDALERNYPGAARRAGRNGEAVVRARIMPDGRVRELRIVSESFAGFGPACLTTLAQSRWTAPIDRNGRTVSTYIQYTCRFEVR